MDDTNNTDAGQPEAETIYANVTTTPPRGDTIERIQELVETNLKPSLVDITDPLSGVTALGTADKDGLHPIPASFFEDYLDAPRFRRGTATLTSLDSFIAHVNRFKGDSTAIFADENRTAPKLTAVLDYHAAGADSDPSHGKHRTLFAFPLSDEWKAWHAVNGKPMGLREFAEFIEDRIADIELPSERDLTDDQRKLVDKLGGVERIGTPTGLYELSKGLHVNEGNTVAEAVNLSSGEGSINFIEQHNDTRSADGRSIIVPTTFVLVIPVFRNGAYYQVLARLRYRTKPTLTFTVELWRTDKTFDHAFDEAVKKAEAETSVPVFLGAPEA
jgi:uncharacterized protein YfdQ (DUF2303 family)